MRALKFWLFSLLLASPAAFALTGSTVSTENVKARLVSEVSSVGPGQTFWVALELDIRDGWHTYWRNPGDSGEPTKLAWVLPPGFSAGDIVWTTPHRFEIAPLVNYGYAKHAVHLVQLTAPKDLKAGTPAALTAKANGRAFEIASYRYDQVFRPLEQLLVPKPAPTPPKSSVGQTSSPIAKKPPGPPKP